MSDPVEEIVRIFKNAINQSTLGLRIRSLFGHLAPVERKPLRQWFMNRYPNQMDYIEFIHANKRHFTYDWETGLINVNRNYDPTKEIEAGDWIDGQGNKLTLNK